MSGSCLLGMENRAWGQRRADSRIGSLPPKRSWKQMLITLPCVSVKTPKSVIEAKSNNVSSVSPRLCSAACFAPLLSLCCLLLLPSKVSSKRLDKRVNLCSSGPSQRHAAGCFLSSAWSFAGWDSVLLHLLLFRPDFRYMAGVIRACLYFFPHGGKETLTSSAVQERH